MPTQHQSNAMLANILPASVLSHRVGHTLALTQSQPSYGQLPCIFRMQTGSSSSTHLKLVERCAIMLAKLWGAAIFSSTCFPAELLCLTLTPACLGSHALVQNTHMSIGVHVVMFLLAAGAQLM